MKTWPILLLSLLLSACAGMRVPAPLPASELFSDASFRPPSEAIGASDLFTLNPAMQAYLRSPEFTAQLRSKGQQRGLVDALYQKGELKLEYDSSMTRNAAQTFDARLGNCLSLVIMTAAFAKELGMTVRYQDVLTGEHWSRNGGLYFASMHVNLSLAVREMEMGRGYDAAASLMTIDFLPPADVANYRTRPLDEEEIVAMYMNNRAAEALAAHRLDDAYWWARTALTHLPSFGMGYNTLGVIYQRHGDFTLAERVFKAALLRQPEDTVVMHNLVPVLASLGKNAEAEALAKRAASIEPTPAFHYFNKGMTAMKEGRYQDARDLFAREVKRAPYNHEFHFWLALAHWWLGEPGKARAQMALALENSTTRASTRQYSSKLDFLRNHQTPSRGQLN